ncbi:MAG: topoisomerase DNA-binding C4 zinc finger domain-containing protein, partial [Clostridiales bacterium]|nr:topoisomerase DNA-binding C4 zinc finger domain-containing protein [Clostridiales bacterium]
FTEASLIKLLEEKGVGRPSTYAPTVSTILDRNYVVKEGKALRPTPLGEVVNGVMMDKFTDIVDPDFTAKMEQSLDRVEAGEEYWKDVLSRFYSGFEAELKQATEELGDTRIKVPDEESDEVCDLCGKKMVVKMGRFGRFLGCSGFPECSFTKPLVIEMPGKCPKCGSRILKKTSRNGHTYYGCERNRVVSGDPCDFMTWDVPVKDNCPVCGKTMFKASGRGSKKPFCVNEKCPSFLPPEQRPGYRKPKEKTEGEAAATAPTEKTVSRAAAKTGTKTTARKTAARKKSAPTKKASTAKKTAATTTRPKRQMTEAQKEALARGRAKAQANREAARRAKTEG